MTNEPSIVAHVPDLRIALIGYGEVGRIFGEALATRGVARVTAYDILLDQPSRTDEMRNQAMRDNVRLAPSAASAVAEADIVISAVTASGTRDAAASAAQGMRRGAFLLDINSSSPGTKVECGAIVANSGGRYVEAAVMTAVPPYGIRVPMLLGGPDAAALAPTLAALGFAATVESATLGVASAIKMCRSIIVKGMEAIVIESFLAARRFGVENEVLASLAETFPGLDWEKSGSYFFSRVIRHGQRRVEEMREAAAAVREIGLEPIMACAIVDRQAWIADQARNGAFADASPTSNWRECADAISVTTPSHSTVIQALPAAASQDHLAS
jgi:3-hydroxyisobutyrate dehydrogenase-like beta-hydroxyacid dehydrogenase